MYRSVVTALQFRDMLVKALFIVFTDWLFTEYSISHVGERG